MVELGRMDKNGPEIYGKILDFIGDPVFVKDRQRRLVFVNEAICRAFGKTREEVIGHTDYDLVPKAEADVFKERDERVFLTGEEDVNEEVFTAPGIAAKTILTRKKRYIDPAGNPFIVGVFKDITAIRTVEEKLQRANETLEQKVLERTAELKRANEEMQARIEQLNYLNEKGRMFAHRLGREDVLSGIFQTFTERFPGCPLQLVERTNKDFKSVHYSQNSVDGLRRCLDLLGERRILHGEKILFDESDTGFPVIWAAFPGRLWIPFRSGRELLGGAQIFLPKEFGSQFEMELPLLGALSAQASIALDNANHYRALGEKARMESELRVAKNIQTHYMPETPVIPNISLNGVCLPAREIGGDYLDYFQNENGDWVVAIADVCGKGIPAALVMTSLRSCIRAEGRKARSSKELLSAVNRLMGPELQREKSFITCLCIILSNRGDQLIFSRAGHPQLVAYGQTKNSPDVLAAKGIALGMVTDETFGALMEEVVVPLVAGDKFFAYTDGLDEAMNAESQPYGKDRLFRILEEKRDLPPKKLIHDVLEDVRLHVKDHRQYDDMTLLSIEKN